MTVVPLWLIAVSLFSPIDVPAADGTWLNTTTGTWSNTVTNRWVGGVVAGGSGFAANFNTLNLTVSLTVTLGADRTIGHLNFGDTTYSPSLQWLIDGAYTLTLAGAAPTITAQDVRARINTNIVAASGFTMNGNQPLLLGGTDNSGISGTVLNNTASSLAFSTAGAGSVNAAFNLAVSGGQLTASSEGVGIGQTVHLGSLTGVAGTYLRNAGGNDGTNTFSIGALGTDTTFLGVVANSANAGKELTVKTAITKVGTGTLTLSGTNTYTGATIVTLGTLIIDGDQSAATGAVTVKNGGTLAGSGILGGVVTVESGGTLSPGSSPGNQTVAGLVFSDGGNYNWQIHDATGNAGTGYDTYTVTGTGILDLSNLTGAPKFQINLWSLLEVSPDVNGEALHFNPNSDYTWVLVATTQEIANFNAGDFQINVGAINGASGFANPLAGGGFSVLLSEDGTDLLLKFTAAAVPEPSAAWLLAAGLTVMILLRRGNRRLRAGAASGHPR